MMSTVYAALAQSYFKLGPTQPDPVCHEATTHTTLRTKAQQKVRCPPTQAKLQQKLREPPASTKPAAMQWPVPWSWRGDMARRGGGRVVGDGGGRAVAAVPMVGLQAAAPIGSA